MKILFLYGWHSVLGGLNPTYLKNAGHDVINPALDDDDLPGLWSLDRCLHLDLDDTEVTDRGLDRLRNCFNLKYLTLRGMRVTEQGAARLQEALLESVIRQTGSLSEEPK